MTAKEMKILHLRRLLSDLVEDQEAVNELAKKIQIVTEEINAISGQIPESELMLCAAYLHHFYTGMESMFDRISRVIDGGTQAGGDYHRELIFSMSRPIKGVRPAIITKDLVEELDDYRRFRHMFRHAYGSELRWHKMKPLAAGIPLTINEIEKAVGKMILFLEELISALEQE